MTGEVLLTFAAKLVATYPNEEVACRAAVSRCYYGVFHLANALLRELGFMDVGHDHGRVAQHLAESNHAIAAEAGQILSALYTHRRRADYDLLNPMHGKLELARQCVERSYRAASLLAACHDEEAKEELASSIAAYRAKLRPRSQ